MKKLATILTLVLAFAFTSNAQSVFHASKSYQGYWNASAGKYDWGSANYVNMRFTIQGDIVLVGDRAGSTYTTSTQVTNQSYTDGSHEYAWKARDENGISCVFKMITYRDGSKLMEVFYSDYAYMYVID